VLKIATFAKPQNVGRNPMGDSATFKQQDLKRTYPTNLPT